MLPLEYYLVRTVDLAVVTVVAVDKVVQRLPLVKPIRAAALDIVFGPEEQFEYVSTTAVQRP